MECKIMKKFEQAYITCELRGNGIADYLKKTIPQNEKTKVLEIGCGRGLIGRCIASQFPSLTSGDMTFAQLSHAKNFISEKKIENINLINFNGHYLPFKFETFDLIVINGVLEWAGVNDLGEDPQKLQQKFLKEACRVLKTGGLIYVGIENRFYLRYLRRDPHNYLPFVTILPRKISNLFTKLITGKPYQEYIYSYWGLKSLLKQANLDVVDFLAPIPGYQYPMIFLDLNNKKKNEGKLNTSDFSSISNELKKSADLTMSSTLRMQLIILCKLNLLKLFANSFAVIVRKMG